MRLASAIIRIVSSEQLYNAVLGEVGKPVQKALHRRHAIQIAAALPETREDALLVLELARGLVDSFLYAPQRPPEPPLGERERGMVVSLSKPQV
jgi:hypothetical protein